MKFCIVGTGRSGTTLLYRMLNAHPDIFVFNETHWLPVMHEIFGTGTAQTKQLMDILARTKHVNGDPTTRLDAEDFLHKANLPGDITILGFCNALGRYFAGMEGKTAWADKTPDYGFFTAMLQLYWPDCKIIHSIRDGASTVRSMAGHPGYRALAAMNVQNWTRSALDFTPSGEAITEQPLQSFIDLWYFRLLRTRDEVQRLAPGSYLETRFEDLIANPKYQLGRIARFAGLNENPEWLTAAAAMIDPSRVKNCPLTAEVWKLFGDPHLQLLDNLGYTVNASLEHGHA